MIMAGTQLDGTYRRRAGDQNIGVMALVGTFSQYGTVPEASIVKIDDDLPLSRACLLGCGVTTGWGSAVNTADVSPGDTVVVIGCGGIGSGAIQGARLAGAEKIVVVDPVEAKREKAFQFGATHFVTSLPEATALVAELTRGVMADSAILTVGLLEGAMLEDAANIIRKGGAVVMTALASMADTAPTLSMIMFTLFQKRLLGSLYGEANPRADIPRRLRPVSRQGHHPVLDEIGTHRKKERARASNEVTEYFLVGKISVVVAMGRHWHWRSESPAETPRRAQSRLPRLSAGTNSATWGHS